MFTPVTSRGGYDYMCKSGDNKQTENVQINAICWEWDTNTFYVFDTDSEWHPTGENAE